MGFLSGLGRMFGPGFQDRLAVSQAIMSGDYGGAAAIRARQAQLAAQAAEAEREQQAAASLIGNAANLTRPDGTPIYSKAQLGAMRPEDISRTVADRLQLRQFTPQGGSTHDPVTGETYRAPARYDDQGRIIDIDSQGQGRQVYDARAGDLNWVSGPWGAFATDRSNRPVASGSNITSPLFPGAGGAPQPQAPANIPSGSPLDPNLAQPQARPTAANGYAQGVGTVLASAGLPQHVVAGILGNGEHESGGRWNQAVGDNGTAFGAFQWRNERVANFQQVTGVHPNQATPEQTAQFVLWELQNPERAGMTRDQVQAIVNAPTAEHAAALFSQHYERPNAALAHNDRRVALARQFAGQGGGGRETNGISPGQGVSLQDQAARGVVMAPPDRPAAQTPYQVRRDRAQAIQAERDLTRTPGQEALDREYAERYANWRLNDFSDVQRNLEQLRDSIDQIRNYNVTGRVLGRLPDFMVDDRVVDTREQVQEVVQRNLRVVLGAQFTEREGERLINRAFNPALDESVNHRRLARLFNQIKRAAVSQESAARYFEQHGSLQGWRGRLPSFADFDPDRPEPTEGRGQRRQQQRPAPNSSPPRGRTQQGVRWRRVGQ